MPSTCAPLAIMSPWPRCVVVIRSSRRSAQADPDRHGLLAHGHVHEPGQLALAVQPADRLLERADQPHRPVRLDELVPGQRHLPSVVDRGRMIGTPSRPAQPRSRRAGRFPRRTSHMLERRLRPWDVRRPHSAAMSERTQTTAADAEARGTGLQTLVRGLADPRRAGRRAGRPRRLARHAGRGSSASSAARCYRYLAALQAQGYVEPADGARRFRLGSRARVLGLAALHEHDFARFARGFVDDLAIQHRRDRPRHGARPGPARDGRAGRRRRPHRPAHLRRLPAPGALQRQRQGVPGPRPSARPRRGPGARARGAHAGHDHRPAGAAGPARRGAAAGVRHGPGRAPAGRLLRRRARVRLPRGGGGHAEHLRRRAPPRRADAGGLARPLLATAHRFSRRLGHDERPAGAETA